MAEYRKYAYDGPIYYYGNKIAEKSEYYTMATNWRSARRNFIYKIANGDYASLYDIADTHIRVVKESPKDVELVPEKEIKHCEHCGYELNDIGECPVCDYGEDDLLD